MKYLLQKSHDVEFGWVLTDTENGVVCRFIEGDFNGSQKFTVLNDIKKEDADKLARVAKEMADWLAENHYEIVFYSPQRAISEARASVGVQLKMAREEKGYTLRHLAKLTGIAFNHISRIEQGRYNANIDTVAVIAAALGREIKISKYFKCENRMNPREDILEMLNHAFGSWTAVYTADREGANPSYCAEEINDIFIDTLDGYVCDGLEKTTEENINIAEWTQDFDDETAANISYNVKQGRIYVAKFRNPDKGDFNFLIWD